MSRMHIVRVAGGHDGLAQPVSHIDDALQDLLEPILIDDGIAVDQIPVVFQRLQLDIVIKAHHLFQHVRVPGLGHLEHLTILRTRCR